MNISTEAAFWLGYHYNSHMAWWLKFQDYFGECPEFVSIHFGYGNPDVEGNCQIHIAGQGRKTGQITWWSLDIVPESEASDYIQQCIDVIDKLSSRDVPYVIHKEVIQA